MKNGRRTKALLIAAAASAIGSSCALASPPNSSFKLIFDDEFNGNTLDTVKWGYNYPSFFPNNGHTHNSQAYWEASQDIVSNGTINLQGINQADPNAPANYSYNGQSLPLNYTSGAINSYNTFQFGPDPSDSTSQIYVEASMKMPTTNGSWPALWMLQSGWPPEIDIMEFPINTTSTDTTVNSPTQYSATWHYGTSGSPQSAGWVVNTPNLTSAFHTYGLLWNSGTLSFYFDGTLQHSTTASVSQATKMYLLLDNAIGGWPGTPPSNATWPSNFMIDYVHVYQTHPNVSGVATSSTSVWNTNGGGVLLSSGNWIGDLPEFQDQIAEFVPVGSAPSAVVSNSAPVIMGGMVFGDPNNVTPLNTGYIVNDGPGEISISNSSGNALVRQMSTVDVNQSISGKLELLTNTTFENDSTAATMLIVGKLTGTAALTKTGVGALELTGSNSFTGTVNVGSGATSGGNVNGSLVITNTNNLAGVTLIKINDNNTANSILQLDATGPNIVLPGTTAFSLNANTAANGTSIAATQIQNAAGDNVINGNWTCNVGGAGYGFESDAGSLTLNGTFQLTASTSKTLFLRGAGNGSFNGAIGSASGTGFSIDMLGTGTWNLNTANDFTGSTTINSGTVALNAVGALPDGLNVANGANLLVAANTNVNTVTDISGNSSAVTTVNSGVTFSASAFTQGSLVNNGTVTLNHTATIGSVSGSGSIAVPAGATVTAGSFSQSNGLVDNGSVTINGNGSVYGFTGTGTVVVGNGTSDNTFQLMVNSPANQIGSLVIAPGSALDMSNNRLLINYGAGPDPIASVAAWLASGYAGGAWNGPGINSSAAAANPGYAIAYADYTDPGNPAGLLPGQIEVRYELEGDADLSGVVNGIDFGIVASDFNQTVTGWDQGDFNYDGIVNGIDFGELAAHFNQGAVTGAAAADWNAIVAFAAENGLLADVPEPASLISVGLLSSALLARRARWIKSSQPHA